MKFIIDSEKLMDLLYNKKKSSYISSAYGKDTIISGIMIMLTIITSEFNDYGFISGKVLEKIMCFISIIFVAYGIFISIKSKNNKEMRLQLFHDIEKLNEQNSNSYSIIAIHNSATNKYLLYYDEQWSCQLFVNFKVRTADKNLEIQNIKTLLSNDLHIEKQDIELSYQLTQNSEKESVGNNILIFYEFNYYYARINATFYKNDSFKIGNIKYEWLLISEMELDDNMMSKNSDVISTIKNCIVPNSD